MSLRLKVGHSNCRPHEGSPARPVQRLPLRVRTRRVLKKVGRTLWNDKVAAAHTVFYLIAAALFLPIIGGLFLFLKDTADSTDKPTAGLRSRAVQGLNQITGSSGLAEYDDASAPGNSLSSSYWETVVGHSGFDLQEMGLVDENLTALSYEKIDNLQRGGLVAHPTDGYINYPEFKTALNLGDNYDFHIRLYPLVQSSPTDPYGVAPIKDAHVAYVANLTTPVGISKDVATHGEWTTLTPQAQSEIAALKALKLNVDSKDKGFDGKAFQPLNFIGTNNPSTYTNLIAVKEGDVIGDTSMRYSASLVGPTKSYVRWFAEDYLWKDAATKDPRFDVIVFGSEADLSRWGRADGSSEDVRQELHDFLQAGGSIIFLGNKNLQADFVNRCDDTSPLPNPCLLASLGAGAPVTTPDVTNQMLSTPNTIRPKNPGTPWEICTPPAANINERNGWIPVEIQGTVGDCASTHFGATTSDRYGRTGGTLIVSDYAISTWSAKEQSKFLANTVMFAVMRSAFLDYGPPIPVQEVVESAERLMLVELPTNDYVDTKIVFYLWKNDCTRTTGPAQMAGENCILDR